MLKQAATLWWLGVLESLNLQRCVVFLVLDSSKALGRAVVHCFVLNGCVLGGSTLLWECALLPAVQWLLRFLFAPVAGPLAARCAALLLQLCYHGLWLLPVYLVTMLVSCGIYNDVAKTAFLIKQKQRQQQDAHASTGQRPAGQAGAAGAGGGGGGGGLEDVAQEVYRVVLFCMFLGEVSLVGRLPYAGPALNVLFLSWLYAYYCFDYKWGLQGVRLAERLAYFERRWAFFAGFGLPMALSTALLPFYQGAAVLAVLFPVYILVACDSDVNAVHDRVMGKSGSGRLRHLPIFALAMWPTQRIVNSVAGGGEAGGGGAAVALGSGGGSGGMGT
ncbi:Protein EI24 [Tetrabaena socialis]|uniref:Protein EI24 n=1 Tax=Tetrabaena socialis TaxID=47790 RepID=A0A2J8ADP4_9CHLO|nr:Protein EI24 [Tetrabaena socialis]|eukprot:PNH10637.1 Protein EI24 [Tetrabaena socialis]